MVSLHFLQSYGCVNLEEFYGLVVQKTIKGIHWETNMFLRKMSAKQIAGLIEYTVKSGHNEHDKRLIYKSIAQCLRLKNKKPRCD